MEYIVLKGPRHPQGAEAFRGMSTKCNQGMHLSEMRCTLRCVYVCMGMQIFSIYSYEKELRKVEYTVNFCGAGGNCGDGVSGSK